MVVGIESDCDDDAELSVEMNSMSANEQTWQSLQQGVIEWQVMQLYRASPTMVMVTLWQRMSLYPALNSAVTLLQQLRETHSMVKLMLVLWMATTTVRL